MVDEFNSKHGQMATFSFSVANAVTQATNVDLVLPGGNTVVVAPKAGSVIAVSVRASADLTAGSATVKVHKDSTELPETDAPTLTLNDTNQEAYSTVRPRAIRFAAGDGLGVSYSSSTDMAPTNTNDFDAQLYVVYDPD